MTEQGAAGHVVTLTHRERMRLRTIEEIQIAARAQVLAKGVTGLSLRAVARDIGMPPSGIYNYFASRRDLLTALRATAYHRAADALRDALREAGRPVGGAVGVARWLAVLGAYRKWGIGNSVDFGLVFGRTAEAQPEGPPADDDPTLLAAQRFATELFTPYSEMLADGTIDLGRAMMVAKPTLQDRFSSFVSASGPLSPHAVAVALGAWSALHGWVSLEAYGHFGSLVSETDRLFEAHALGVLRAVGCDPALLP